MLAAAGRVPGVDQVGVLACLWRSVPKAMYTAPTVRRGAAAHLLNSLAGWLTAVLCRYKRVQNEFTGTLTGKAIEWGGSNIRPEATGYGAVYFGLEILKDMNDTIKVSRSICWAVCAVT